MNLKVLFKNSFFVLLVKLAGMSLALASSVLLARILGPNNFGYYTTTIAMATILSVVCQFGFPQFVTREIAHGKGAKDICKYAAVQFLIALVLLSLFLLACYFLSNLNYVLSFDYRFAIAISCFLIVLAFFSGVERGRRNILLSQIPEFLIKNALMVIIVFALYDKITLDNIFYITLGAMLLSILLPILFLLKSEKGKFYIDSIKCFCSYKTKQSRGGGATILILALPFAGISISQVVINQVDIIILGQLATTSDVGIYKAVISISTLLLFAQQISGVVIGPYFAEYNKNKKFDQLKKIYYVFTMLCLLFTIIVASVFYKHGVFLIDFLYGSDYIKGYEPLLILMLGNFFNIAVGPVGILLSMTNNEKITFKIMLLGGVINILSNIVLIPYYGMYGAAISSLISSVVWNFTMFYYAKKVKVL